MNKIILYATLFLLPVTSCDNNISLPQEDIEPHTVLVYMIATNSLSVYAQDDIEEMIEGVAMANSPGSHLLLYEATYNDAPSLYEIATINGTTKKHLIKKYSSDIRSTEIKRMSEVIADMQSYAPADKYGLVLWSHATGWLRTLEKDYTTTRPLDFGDDYGHTMSITDLANAIPDNTFDFIYADACYMGCVEIAYQLRNKTRYYISSPTETLAWGMPYEKNIPCFFESNINLVQACQNTHDYYATQGSYSTISLVDCSMMEEIANLCRQIHSTSDTQVVPGNIQCYNRNSRHVFYDFLQYTTILASPQQAKELYEMTNKTVIYKAATPKFGDITIDAENYSGLSTYIPGTASTVNEKYYKTLDWYNKIYN